MKKIIPTLFISIFLTIVSFAKNIEELKQKAEEGDADAQYLLGVCYIRGNNVKRNPNEAVKWFYKSAEQGYIKAQHYLNYCYHYIYGLVLRYHETLKDIKELKQEAEEGDADAQCFLGLHYYFGYKVERKEKEAIKWFQKAAEQGNLKAQYYLSWHRFHKERNNETIKLATKC